MGEIIQPIDIFVQPESVEFWYSVYGLKPSHWEDILIYYKTNGKLESFSTDVHTKGYFRAVYEYNLKEDTSLAQDPKLRKEMIKDFNEECSHYGKTFEELIETNEILYAHYYDDPNSPNFYEVEFEAKRNSLGIKPSYISMFYPTEELSIKVIKEAASRYCKDFCKIAFSKVRVMKRPIDVFSKYEGLEEAVEEYKRNQNIPTKEEKYETRKHKKTHILKSFKKYKKEMEKIEQNRKEGKTLEMRLTPSFIAQTIGKEAIAEFRDQIDYGFYRNGSMFAKLKDGTEKHLWFKGLEVVE